VNRISLSPVRGGSLRMMGTSGGLQLSRDRREAVHLSEDGGHVPS